MMDNLGLNEVVDIAVFHNGREIYADSRYPNLINNHWDSYKLLFPDITYTDSLWDKTLHAVLGPISSPIYGNNSDTKISRPSSHE